MDAELARLISAARQGLQMGRIHDVEALCRKALSIDSENVQASLMLAMALGQKGRPDLGIDLLRNLLAAQPDSLEVLAGLTVLYRNAGRSEESIQSGTRAVQLAPSDAAALSNLALSYLSNRQDAEAVEFFRRAISLRPDQAPMHHFLAVALEHIGRLEEAKTEFQKAIGLAPKNPSSYGLLGRTCGALGHRQEAIAAYRMAAEMDPNPFLRHFNLAQALLLEGEFDEAEAQLRQAMELNPNSASVQEMIAIRLQERGEFDDAIVGFQRAIGTEPEMASPYYGLIYCKKVDAGDRALLEKMEELASGERRSQDERRFLQYALGKAYDDLKEYETAISHFDEANRISEELLQSQGKGFDSKRDRAAVDAIVAAFPNCSFEAQDAAPCELPVLILGMIRSGTTLVEQILSSHTKVAAGGELPFWLERASALAGVSDAAASQNAIADYVALLEQTGPGKLRVTDKMPSNMMSLGLIHRHFPGSRVIHCRRAPVDNALSIYMTSNSRSPDFAHKRENIVAAYGSYARLMEHWHAVLPPGTILDVSYEELVSDRERVSRRLVEFCGLEWEAACLHPEANRRVVRTPSLWQVRQPVYTSSMNRWRNYEPWLGALAELNVTPK